MIGQGILIDLHRQSLNQGDSCGQTPLAVAINYAHPDTALKIVTEPNISWKNYRDRLGQTYLHTAVQLGCEAVVDRLLKLDADLPRDKGQSYNTLFTCVHDNTGKTPLLLAAQRGHLGIVKQLLAHSGGRELNVADNAGRTPAHQAARFGQVEVLRHLATQKGFEAGASDKKGMSLLHCATVGGHVATVELVLDMQLTPIDARDRDGRTALCLAACRSSVSDRDGAKTVRLLISRSADLEAADNTGVTPLMEAAGQRSADLVSLLAPLVSDINNTDNKGQTVLHHLGARADLASGHFAEEGPKRFRSCLECLLKHGAVLDIRDGKGDTLSENLQTLANTYGRHKYYEPYLTVIREVRAKVDALMATA